MKTLGYVALGVVLVALPLSLTQAAGKPAVGDRVIDFELKDLDGKAVKTAEARKDKPVILKFGATWCGWCNRQIPHLNQVQKEYGKKVAVIDIDVREAASRVRAHNKKRGVAYLTLLDPDGAVAGKYGVSGIPVVIVADKTGKIVYRGYFTKYEVLKKVLDRLL